MKLVGLTTPPSAHTTRETIDCLQAQVKVKSVAVFAHSDRAAGAKEVSPTQHSAICCTAFR
jgi:hypothetical protein